LIYAGQFDARISLNRMELIFGIEELISEGIMSIEEGEEIIQEAREVITTEKLLYSMKKEEVLAAYNEYQKKIDSKDLPIACKEILLNPGRDIVKLVYESNNVS
jgi:predicted metal-binding protein